ncbi:MAG TPA: N-6 DNA methylase [Polyangiaceae bacterium]|nr:N-6 DNA methylase [Polyangiaceae bacterium]
MLRLSDETQLIGLAVALGADRTGKLSTAETRLVRSASAIPPAVMRSALEAITKGRDPLGDAYCQLRSAARRRPTGATYTPLGVVGTMLELAASSEPVRIVDPGAGSGRFIVAAARRFPNARLLAVESDPLAALLVRAHLAAAGYAARAQVFTSDYRKLELAPVRGATLFLGNPPYVRHHLIDARWKAWLRTRAAGLGASASQLAGLHVHFFLATALLAKPGDQGVFVTAAEWLDVNYGALVRNLFLGPLGGTSLHVVNPTARVFPDADATAVIACFRPGTRASHIHMRCVRSSAALEKPGGTQLIARERAAATTRWSSLARKARRAEPGLIELGELCRVHRGQVTGANKIWIAAEHAHELPPSVLFPSVTRARELLAAGLRLTDASRLRSVIDLPCDLDLLGRRELESVQRFLKLARNMGADLGFVARHRRAWWSVGLREPAPILATYMARRPPAFVRNLACARHLNIAHGLYPRAALSGAVLDALAAYLNATTRVQQGRTYAGGLTKFEPKEMERLLVPPPEVLAARTL